MMKHESPVINGDGEYSRDFTYVDNVVQANQLALLADNPEAVNQVFNVAFGERTTLNQLFAYLRENLGKIRSGNCKAQAPVTGTTVPETSRTVWPVSTRPAPCWATLRNSA